MNINNEIKSLVDYAVRERLIENEDRIYAVNRLLEILHLDHYTEGTDSIPYASVEDILEKFRQWAVETSFVPNDSNEVLDLFDTKLMSVFVA